MFGGGGYSSNGRVNTRGYYEKSNLAVFLSFVYLSSTLWGLPTAKVHDPVPWGDSLRPYANPALYNIDVPALSYIYAHKAETTCKGTRKVGRCSRGGGGYSSNGRVNTRGIAQYFTKRLLFCM
jgi:hypothetical protein